MEEDWGVPLPIPILLEDEAANVHCSEGRTELPAVMAHHHHLTRNPGLGLGMIEIIPPCEYGRHDLAPVSLLWGLQLAKKETLRTRPSPQPQQGSHQCTRPTKHDGDTPTQPMPLQLQRSRRRQVLTATVTNWFLFDILSSDDSCPFPKHSRRPQSRRDRDHTGRGQALPFPERTQQRNKEPEHEGIDAKRIDAVPHR